MRKRHVVVGRVAGAFGIRGWVRVESWTQPRDNICSYSPWLVGANENWKSYAVDEFSKTGERIFAGLSCVGDRDAARELYNCDIAVTMDQLKPLPHGEYYQFQLIGMNVVSHKGDELGHVKELMETGACNVLVVENKSGEKLIPYVKGHTVKRVDLTAGIIEVVWESDW